MTTRGTNVILSAILFFVVTAITIGSYSYWYVVEPWRQFQQEQRTTEQLFDRLQAAPPPQVARPQWDQLWNVIGTAYGNVTYSPHHETGTLKEMQRFRHDVDQHLASEDRVDVETARWIFNRLAEFGPEDKAYIEKVTPEFEATAKTLVHE